MKAKLSLQINGVHKAALLLQSASSLDTPRKPRRCLHYCATAVWCTHSSQAYARPFPPPGLCGVPSAECSLSTAPESSQHWDLQLNITLTMDWMLITLFRLKSVSCIRAAETNECCEMGRGSRVNICLFSHLQTGGLLCPELEIRWIYAPHGDSLFSSASFPRYLPCSESASPVQSKHFPLFFLFFSVSTDAEGAARHAIRLAVNITSPQTMTLCSQLCRWNVERSLGVEGLNQIKRRRLLTGYIWTIGTSLGFNS